MENSNADAWVNRQWTTETTPRGQLMAHNNLHDSSSPEDAPVYGLLTRTLVHSPVIRQIIPARIRSKDLNDVVFVGVSLVPLARATTLVSLLRSIECRKAY